VLYPRVRRVRLLYADVMGERPPLSMARRTIGVALTFAGALVAFGGGNLAAAGWVPAALATWPPNILLSLVVLPGLATAVLGLALL